jgi:hypothetical protein
MGRFLSFNIRLSTTDNPVSVLALRSHPHFNPVSLGGIEGHEGGDHWFLSGYALEDFVRRFPPRVSSRPAVDLATGSDAANAPYLQRVAETLKSKQMLPELSPLERVNEAAKMTFLDECGIGEEEIEKCTRWLLRHPNAVLYLYGTVSLTMPPRSNQAVPWRRAFREVVESPRVIGPPFVVIRVGRVPLSESQRELTVITWSTVWLDNHGDLSRLVSLAEAVVSSEEGHIVSSSLTVEGGPFVTREMELRAAFSSAVGSGRKT